MELGGPVVSADPDIAGHGVDGDASIIRSNEGDASVIADPVECGMPVLDEPRASKLAVARRIPSEVRVAQGEAVVGAEPDVVLLGIPDDAQDVAELFAPSFLVTDY